MDSLDPSFRPKIQVLLDDLERRGIKCIVTSGRRTIHEQNELYDQGRRTPGDIVTKAKGGESPHNFGLAADLCPLDSHGNPWWNAPDDVWQVIHNLAEERGYLDSGYDWKFCDRPHIEDPNWKTTQALWKEGKIKIV